MGDLAQLAGLSIAWTEDGTLTFAKDLVVDETKTRLRGALRPVALQPETCEPATLVQYWMYNGIAEASRRDVLRSTGMQYELTLMPPRSLGRERAKTLGHLHSFPENCIYNYPEVCEVLHGRAYFVFQTMDVSARTAPFCAVLEAHPGDKVIIPPNLHHLTINAGDEPLLSSDVISLAVSGIYAPLSSMNGAAYLNTLDQGWIRNPMYSTIGELNYWTVQSYAELGLVPERPLYQLFSETPQALARMVEPERFGEVFP